MTKQPFQRKFVRLHSSPDPNPDPDRSEESVREHSTESEDEPVDFLYTPHITREEINAICSRVMPGFEVRDEMLYQRALVHKSIQKFVRRATQDPLEYLRQSNERLEYLGDSVVGLAVADFLYSTYDDQDEGYLTRSRTKIVRGKTLAGFAESIGLSGNILMSRQVKRNRRFLEDAFEAFVGAMYFDKGFETAKTFVLKVIERYFDENLIDREDNFKDVLLRYAQFANTSLPEYNVVKEEGKPHERMFTVEVVLFGKRQGKGCARVKKEAEQIAAKQALRRLNVE